MHKCEIAPEGMYKFSHRYQKVLLLILAASGLSPRLLFLLSDTNAIICLFYDDAFYYLKTAQNIVFEHSVTFDGFSPTNGFQPLWMGLLLPIVGLVQNPWLIVKTVVLVNIALDLITALLIFWVLKKCTKLWYVPLIGFSVYYFNLAVVTASVNGMETSLTSFIFTALLVATMVRTKAPSKIKYHRPLLGLLAGLLFLARTDTVFYIAVIFLIAVFEEKKRCRLKTAFILGACSFAVAGPWLVWNIVNFGSIMQVSGVAMPYTLKKAYMAEGHSTLDMLAHSFAVFKRFVTKGIYRSPLGLRPFTFWACIVTSAVIIVTRWKVNPRMGNRMELSADLAESDYLKSLRRSVKVLLFMSVGAFILVFVHSFVRWYPRPYYFTQLLIIVTLILSVSVAFLEPSRILSQPTSKWPYNTMFSGPGIIVLFLAVSMWGAFSVNNSLRHGRGRGPHQVQMLEAAYWLRDNLREDETVCGFNVGIMGFISGRRVVNLDGAINNDTYAAIRRAELFSYMRSIPADYYADWEPQMLNMYSTFLGADKDTVKMILLRDFQSQNNLGKNSVKIYRLDWQESM